MKEFISAYEDIAEEINPTFLTNEDGEIQRDEEGNPIPAKGVIPFKIDGRLLYAHPLEDGQLAFMLASLGRGQSDDQRFAAILNIMFSSLRPVDQDYIEGRLLERDPKKKLALKTIEGVFEHLTEEWFKNPTQSPSDSAPSPLSDGQN